ncbi:ComF family protein [Asaccharospora irregularis]|uniref:Competence protein ComFC n=1 Tax=Asaccharospora irregularis DSM 2635 TaxID=1121321 RepID=A0A1M5PQ02_9FIRM|nr:ComF family protein [Asaccharospora irregularis]SHH03761.1 competence protein ComFC [Asaccharospora irregularis DSM 2635]
MKDSRVDGFLKKRFKEVVDVLLDLIYPENISCIICNKPIKKTNTYSICKDCFKEINFILDGCIKCGKPIINHSLESQSVEGCNFCINRSFYFEKVISCMEYNDISKRLILGLKYQSNTYMCKYIAQIMKDKLELEKIKFDYIVFVPLHKKREKKRGFNQSQKIADYLGKLMDISVVDCVYRKKNTKRLYNLNRDERKRELKDVFEVKDNIEKIKKKDVLLIDDIFTTGATANELSRVLKFSDVNSVFVMTLLTKVSDNYIWERVLE